MSSISKMASRRTPETVETLIANPPPGAPVPPILPPQDGFLKLDSAKFAASFAADVDQVTAQFMAASQLPPRKRMHLVVLKLS